MSWAKLDDRFWSNRKVRAAWRQHGRAIGLHVMAITYCAQHETDGHVDADLAEMLIPAAKERAAAIAALVDAGLWIADGDGWLINDYLEFNESRQDAQARRRRDSERKRRRNPGGLPKDSTRNPDGFQAESARNPSDPSRARAFDPTRPDPTLPPLPPRGKRASDWDRYRNDLAVFVGEHFPGVPAEHVKWCADSLRHQKIEPTVSALRPMIERHYPQEAA